MCSHNTVALLTSSGSSGSASITQTDLRTAWLPIRLQRGGKYERVAVCLLLSWEAVSQRAAISSLRAICRDHMWAGSLHTRQERASVWWVINQSWGCFIFHSATLCKGADSEWSFLKEMGFNEKSEGEKHPVPTAAQRRWSSTESQGREQRPCD